MNNKEEKLREIADELYDRVEHSIITTSSDWQEHMYALLEQAFPDLERVGDLIASVDDYAHDKHSFGFCDLCGEYIDYNTDPWHDLNEMKLGGDTDTNTEWDWYQKSQRLWRSEFADSACDEDCMEDVCSECYHRLTTEEGFREVPLQDDIYRKTGGKSHAKESMGEFLDEAGIKATAPAEEISRALYECGLEPLTSNYKYKKK